MKNISIDRIDEIKNNKTSIILIWSEGCHACKSVKPYFEELSNKYTNFNFYKLQFGLEILPFYNKYIPKEEVLIQAKYENGDSIFTVDNKPLMIQKLDEFNRPVFESPILFPNFLFFTKDIIDVENEHGFIGNIPGFNKAQVDYILNEMSTETQLVSNCG